MIRAFSLTAGLAIAAALLTSTSSYAAERTWTDIGTLGFQTSARAMNDHGVVVGSSYAQQSEYHAFVWHNDQMLDIGIDGENSQALAVNNHDQVVGNRYTDTALEYLPFLWDDGQMTDLTPALGYASVGDINDSGKIIGTQIRGDERIPFIYDLTTGELTQLAEHGNANAINNNDQIVGSRAISGHHMATLWSNGETLDIGVLPDYVGSVATDINDNGNVTGWATDEYNWTQRGFYWNNGVMQEIGTEEYGWNVPMGINDREQIIGTHYQGDGEIAMPFVWSDGENELLTTGDLPDDLQFGYGVAINSTGQIVIDANSRSYISNATEIPPEPVVTIDDVIVKVEVWQQDGKLPWIDGIVMQAFLRQAKSQIESGDTSAACLRLDMVFAQIYQLEQKEKLSSQDARELRANIEAVASSISCHS